MNRPGPAFANQSFLAKSMGIWDRLIIMLGLLSLARIVNTIVVFAGTTMIHKRVNSIELEGTSGKIDYYDSSDEEVQYLRFILLFLVSLPIHYCKIVCNDIIMAHYRI